VGVIFDHNDFKSTECINANSIGYVPVSLKVHTFEGGNLLTKMPTGSKKYNRIFYLMYIISARCF
jgi:hypothetical protein